MNEMSVRAVQDEDQVPGGTTSVVTLCVCVMCVTRRARQEERGRVRGRGDDVRVCDDDDADVVMLSAGCHDECQGARLQRETTTTMLCQACRW